MGIGVVMSGNLGGSVPDDDGEDPLPGLEPDEPAQPTESAQPIEPEQTAGERIDRGVEEWVEDLEAAAESHQWTDKELDDWFEDDFGGAGAFKDLLTAYPASGERLGPSELARRFPDLQLAVDSLLPSRQVGVDLGHLQWADLARDTKIGFRETWEGEFSTDPSEWPQHSSGSQTHASPDQYLASKELTLRADAALQLSPDARSERPPAAPATGPTVPRWVWVGGGLGTLGLVLAGSFLVFGGSDDSDSVAGTEPAAVVEEPATAVEDEPVAEVQDAPAGVAEEQPGVAVDEEPAVAVEDEPTVVVEEDASSVRDVPDAGVADPFDLLTVVEASLLADPAGDLVAKAAFVVPWPEGTPSNAEVYDMFVQVGIAFDGQFNAASWSVTAGKTRGVGYIYGDAPAAVDGELWLTPDGVLFGKLPGLSPTGGLSVSALGPDAVIAWDAYVILEEGGEIQRWNGEFPLGEIGEFSDATPPGAQRVETEFGPVELVIPGG